VHHVVCPFTPQLPLVLINRPRRDGTLSWRWYTAAVGGIRTRDRKSGTVPLGHRVPWGGAVKLKFSKSAPGLIAMVALSVNSVKTDYINTDLTKRRRVDGRGAECNGQLPTMGLAGQTVHFAIPVFLNCIGLL